MEPTFFETPLDFRAWLAAHHATETELWVGIYKQHTGLPTIDYEDAVTEGLCYGWIDGKKMRYDDEAYMLRFTPRKKGTVWSESNLNRVKELLALDLMEPAGLAVYETRKEDTTPTELTAAYQKRLQALPEAQAFFDNLPPGAKRASIRWVMQPKREATRDDHFETLLACCARGERIPQLAS